MVMKTINTEFAYDDEFYSVFNVPDIVKPFIHYFVTKQEVNLVLLLNQGIKNERGLSVSLGLTGGDLKDLLESAYRRAVIDYDGQSMYTASTFYDRLQYFTQYENEKWLKIPVKVRQSVDKWFFGMFTLRTKEKLAKDSYVGNLVLPIDKAIEYLEKNMENAEGEYYIVPCVCRTTAKSCSNPLNTCIVREYGPNTHADRGYAQTLSFDKVKQLMYEFDEKKLVHIVSQDGNTICHCETCCCYELRTSLELESKGRYPQIKYTARIIADKCVQCKLCMDRCYFDAITFVESCNLAIDGLKCYGCGLCEKSCPQEAVCLESLFE